jgi:hypothetical protein
VLVVQLDVVRAEPLEGALGGGADVGRAAVGDAGAAAGVGDEAELGGHHDLAAAALAGAVIALITRRGTGATAAHAGI